MTARVAGRGALAVFLVFALGYFISYLFRGVNIGFGPPLQAELGLSSRDLGLLTGVYFLAFSAVQIPAGILIDTYGPRRVNAILMLLAAAGTVVFGASHSIAGLVVGRAMVGIGVAVCLGAAFKALVQVFPLSRLPMLNGLIMAIGGMGGVVVGTPLSALMAHLDWRTVSMLIALPTVLVAVAVWFGGRAGEQLPARRPTLAEQWQGTRDIARDPGFWRLSLFAVLTGGAFYAVQSLWVAPYLRDVRGLAPDAAAGLVSVLGLSMVGGNIVLGLMARKVERLGLGLRGFAGLGMSLFLVVQLLMILPWSLPVPDALLWVAYGVFGSATILSYAVMAERYPVEMLGRVSTTMTLSMFLMIFVCQAGVGAIVDLWPTLPDGRAPAAAHRTAWAVLLGLQLLGAAAYFWPARRQTGPGTTAAR
ncbi:MFS transporter [Achromobacter sp. GG226]|uniref:MFS transporter n=1 Tax=Verticiella alkaliphila TaxID=2779529 RepID=UPI001C0E079F|nr:MFS transporter [Verticiella sp. GG226]MBU4611390.1 MFS transporter [Verticiella sp. GG226]